MLFNSLVSNLWKCTATLLMTLGLCSVWAKNLVVEQAWLDDPGGRLTWEQVRQSPDMFQPYKGVLSRGFGSSTIWIRVRIDPHRHAASVLDPDRLILRLRPVYLDRIEIYDPIQTRQPAYVTGDHFHPKEQAIPGLDFMIPIARGESARDLWVKVQSTSTRQISIQALELDELNSRVHQQELLYALYIGVIIVFLAWGCVHWLFSLDRLVGAFSVAQFCALVYALCGLGYTRVFWPSHLSAHWLDTLTSLFSILAVSSAVLFHILHVREFQPPTWLQRTQWLLLAALPVKLLLLALGQPMWGLHLNMLEILITPSIFLLSVILSKGWIESPRSPRPALKRGYVIGFYVLLLGVMMIAVLPGLALTSGGEIPLYIVQAHGLFTAFLIMVMLQYRDRVMRKKQNDLSLNLERSVMQAEHEKQMREEQEKLLSMLAHELKTPLATVQMRLSTGAEGTKEIRTAVRDMDNVIERCVQTLQLSDQRLHAHMVRFNLVTVLQDAVLSCAQPDRIHLKTPPEALIDSDHQLLSIIFSNLLENACKYASPGTPIQIELTLQTDSTNPTPHVRLVFSNFPGASGWPDAAQIFEKYYRSPQARRQAGTGLGLYLVKNLIQVLHGHIEYAPDDGQLRFVLTLPLWQAS